MQNIILTLSMRITLDRAELNCKIQKRKYDMHRWEYLKITPLLNSQPNIYIGSFGSTNNPIHSNKMLYLGKVVFQISEHKTSEDQEKWQLLGNP